MLYRSCEISTNYYVIGIYMDMDIIKLSGLGYDPREQKNRQEENLRPTQGGKLAH